MYCDLFGKNTGCGEFPPGELGLGLGLGIHQGEISSERIGWGGDSPGGNSPRIQITRHMYCDIL